MHIRHIFCILLSVSIFILHTGSIRKNEDPVARTQTDPIELKEKLDELKDGVKGAPAPSFKYYEKEAFLTNTATQTQKEEAGLPKKEEMLPGVFEENPPTDEEDVWEEEDDEAAEEEASDEDWWVEDATSQDDQELT